MATPRLCAIDGCCKTVIARSMCTKHYQQWRKSADPAHFAARAKPGEPLQWLLDRSSYEGDECLTWPFAKYPSGYGVINFADGRSAHASREMCRLAHGEPADPEMHAAHSCGNGHLACVNPRHLAWKTRAGNEADKIDHGTSNRGVSNGHAKLDERTVRVIRASDLGPTALSNLLGISAPTICDIRARRSWAWLD